MKGEFSFCGVDIASIGLEYAPEAKDTYVYAPAKANVHEETFDGHDGGYAYGASKEPKEFILRCYYEEEHIAKGLMANVHNLFKVGKKGVLIFKRRPWCYYYATVTDIDTSDIYTYMNGLIVITMKAYYPFARGLPVNNHLLYNLVTDDYHDEILKNTAMFDKAYMVPQTEFNKDSFNLSGSTWVFNEEVDEFSYPFASEDKTLFECNGISYYEMFMEGTSLYYDPHIESTPATRVYYPGFWESESYKTITFKTYTSTDLTAESRQYEAAFVEWIEANATRQTQNMKSILLYNPGTERAKVDIVISGTAGDGVTITNKTTQQACRYVAFTDTDGEIYTDGFTGRTVVDKDGTKSLAFLYHDYGFIELEPAFPILRELYVNYSGATVTVTNILYQDDDEKEWYEDKYIFLGKDGSGKWYQINRCLDKHTISLKKPTESSGSCRTCIVLMNEITVSLADGAEINKLSFIYKPTYS